MSQKFENLSALVDGEDSTSTSSSSHVLDAVKNDAELQLKWKSYHLIRDGLRQELPANINFDIADRVAQALESEPAILAPKKTWRDLPLVGTVIPFAKQGGQMAIAASVAVAMIIGVQQFNQTDANQPFNAAPPIPGIQGGLSPVSFDQTRAIPNSDGVEQRRRINAYLTDHKQQLRFKTMQLNNDESTILDLNIKNEEAQSDIVENTPQ
ncbi:sigma-E factor negative regulatory protein [Paraglaciecola arctica]|uniref:Anti-sigma-E factor RseA n=1 Tax=Paraglaciecola arctica BSs20135 TaxID=493475 RepID=K6ZBY6_9ALTE|nr:RseA family anti-sigma factor [Paraglaciecola arctica]GAC20935.1 sigma-E factor negative regulatory protein RseA [Paraglaciecola arctica BSs20135]